MNKSESIAKLADALSRAQVEMPAAKFDSKNPFLKNEYASLGSIIDTAKPVLGKHGLAVSQLPYSEGDQVGIETVLMHQSGEWISTRLSMNADDEKGKSAAQVAGSIITYLRRYSIAGILGMYSDEDTDGNESKPVSKPVRTAKPAPKSDDDIMTIERAVAIENSEGVKYGEIPNGTLQAMILGINKGLQNVLDDEKRAEYLEKKQAIGVILKARANKEI